MIRKRIAVIDSQKLKPKTALSLVTPEGAKIKCLLTILKKEWFSKLKTKDRGVHLKPDNPYNSTAPDAALVDSLHVLSGAAPRLRVDSSTKLAISMQ